LILSGDLKVQKPLSTPLSHYARNISLVIGDISCTMTS
jgi:hypothetical protein